MKKLLSIAAMAMVAFAATTFVSCGSDDDDDNTNKNTVDNRPSYDVNFMVLATPEQLLCYDMSYVIDIDDKDTTIYQSTMTKMTDASKYETVSVYKYARDIAKAFDQLGSETTIQVYTTTLGKFKSGKFVVKKIIYTPKKERPTFEKDINILASHGFYSTSNIYGNSIEDAEIYKGIATDDETLTKFGDIVAAGNGKVTFSF